ncbi:MAG: lamin tail domain-containing protein [Candidatus Cloacimonetes bacterium]|nr:lamin tail domain-containing protein [Candidatus Cloacimonadota bacterium]
MKKMIILLLMFSVLSIIFADVFITELADPNNTTAGRYVELYNNGASAIDFSTGWQIQRATNENTYWQTAKNLTGTIAAGGFYVVCVNSISFTSVYGVSADQAIGTGGPADSNGDDQIRLLSPGAVVEDMFGVLGEDGSGTNHEFEDGRAERAFGTLTGNTTYTFAEWNIWNDTGGAGTTNDPQDAPADFDPGSWIGASAGSDTSVQFSTGSASVSEGVGTYDLTVTILNEDASNATTCDVVLTVGDAADVNSYTTQGVTFPAGSSANQIVTVTITDDTNYEGDETLTFEIQNVAGGNSAAVGVTNAFNMTINDNDPATTVLPYNETFDADLGDCYTNSVSGASKEWYWYSSGQNASCNGYNSGDIEEDWMILPGINLDNYSDETMTFDSEYQYGTDDLDNYLKLYYSTDYTGLGDPSGSTWVELTYTQPSAELTWTGSGNIDLSSIIGSSVWIGFKYHYESGSYRRWSIDNILISEPAEPTVGDLFITEIVGDGADPGKADDDDGFVEIWNATSRKLDLTNIQLRYHDKDTKATYTQNLNGVLDVDEFIVLTGNNITFSAYYLFDADYENINFDFRGLTPLYDGVDINNTLTKAVIDEFSGAAPFDWDQTMNYKRNSTGSGATEGNWDVAIGTGDPKQYPGNPLPVSLSSFFAEYASETLSIYWTTASETDNSYWKVYRANSDNFDESIIVSNNIDGAGTTAEPTDYIFIDETDYMDNTTYYYWIQSVDYSGTTHLYGSVSIEIHFEQDNPTPPPISDFGLMQNYPNPFNPNTEILFVLKESANAIVTVFNVKGEKVSTIHNDFAEAGVSTSICWDGTDHNGKTVSSGIYFYKLSTKYESHMRKMLLVK